MSADQYLARGWAVVPVNRGGKCPTIRGWNTQRFNTADFRPDDNVGIRFGADSAGLVDIDLDCHEAIDLADIYLPATGAEFGRTSKPRSHRLYVAPGSVFAAYRDPLLDGKNTLLELRANSESGGAHQTIVPPSIADGEQRVWYGDTIEPAPIEARTLLAAVTWLAIGCLVDRYLSKSAARHPAPDLPRLLWEWDHDLARPAYDWLGWQHPDTPQQRCPRYRSEQDPHDLDLAEIVTAIPNNFDWHSWNNIGLAIFAAARDSGDGFVVFDHFSAKSPKYDPYETAARWRGYERSPPSKTGIGKLAKLAYAAGWRRGV